MRLGETPAGHIEAWSELVRAMPAPTALLDATGRLIATSRWVEGEPGDQLLHIDDSETGLYRSTDGQSRWRARPMRGTDVLLATRERFGAGDHLLRRFFSSGDILYVVYDQQGRIVEWNEAWQRILGYDDQVIFGLDSWSLLPPEDQDMRAVVERDLRERGRSEPSWRMTAADGTYRVIQWTLHFDAKVGRCFGVGRDVSEDQQRRDELHRRAYTDDLTGLANRARTLAELDRHLRSGDSPAVLFCDLDRFKIVNDSLGHAVGDQLLALLGQRLSTLFGDRTLVGRLGGDEFAVVVGNGGLEAAQAAAASVYSAVNDPFMLQGREVRVGVSIGIRVAEGDGDTAERMLDDADLAVYRAKERRRGSTEVFGPKLKEASKRRFDLESELRAALAVEAFVPWFQPIVALADGEIVGAEALMRWHWNGAVRTPGEFLDVAIESGLISEIGRQVMSRAFRDFAVLASERQDLYLTVNVSAREFADIDFTSWLVSEVELAGLDAHHVVIEITESVAIDGQVLKGELRGLQQVGFRVALDDFGTGHSSLAHLRTLPIDMIKIDRSFVADLVGDDTTRALTGSIVDLCNTLGLTVIFEGVEEKCELHAVEASLGQFAQGYLFDAPMPFEALGHRARSRSRYPLPTRLADTKSMSIR